MRRSDNFPHCSTVEKFLEGESGKVFIHTGFPVKSAIVVPTSIPEGSELFADPEFDEEEGFNVIFNKMPGDQNLVKFSYQAT